MPTGFTAPIAEGKTLTFKQFAMRCSRAFGAFVDLRDSDIPLDVDIADLPKRLINPYYEKHFIEATLALDELRALTPAQAEERALHDYLSAKERWDARMREGRELNARYDALLAAIDAWQVPTDDHRGLQDFMRQQIDVSKHDPSYDPEPVQVTAVEWLDASIRQATRTLEFAKKNREEEVERCESNNRWVAELVKSLG